MPTAPLTTCQHPLPSDLEEIRVFKPGHMVRTAGKKTNSAKDPGYRCEGLRFREYIYIYMIRRARWGAGRILI